MRRNRNLFMAAFGCLCLLAAGCAEVVQVGTSVSRDMGVISAKDKEILDRTAAGAAQAARPMTEKEEYYLGRAVGATVLSHYRLDNNARLTRYVNQVGQTLALSSDVPAIYGGYHFAVLDTGEVNAISCPGGIILISRGMIDRARSEEELAAILAHEIAHVNHRDGAKAVQSSRWVEVVTTLGTGAAGRYGPKELAQLTSLFEGSVNDVVRTIVVNGYGREQEVSADQSALVFLSRAGYDPHGLTDYLERLAREQQSGQRQGFFSTHPGMAERLQDARAVIAKNNWKRIDHRDRDKRFYQNR